MQLIFKQIGFAVLALMVSVLVIIPSFVVVHLLLDEGYGVALIGVIGTAATLVVVFSRRYKGGSGPPPPALSHEEIGSKQQTDSFQHPHRQGRPVTDDGPQQWESRRRTR